MDKLAVEPMNLKNIHDRLQNARLEQEDTLSRLEEFCRKLVGVSNEVSERGNIPSPPSMTFMHSLDAIAHGFTSANMRMREMLHRLEMTLNPEGHPDAPAPAQMRMPPGAPLTGSCFRG